MGHGPDHRGAIGNNSLFAGRFIEARMASFDKDMNICLTPVYSTRVRVTHAYFPALGNCCGTLEYMAALFRGNVNGVGWQQVADWAEQYLPQPDFDRDTMRVLFGAFRNTIAHRGIASGVWIDHQPGGGYGRRLTWKITANARRPACEIVEEQGTLTKDPPWPCDYTHRVHIHLKGLQVDIRNGAKKFSRHIANSDRLQQNFADCMGQLYPEN